MSVAGWIVSFGLVAGLAAATGLAFARLWTSPSAWRSAAARLALVVFSASLTLLLIELVFVCLPPQTDSWAFTLASRRWRERYFQPVNSLGFRDDEHSPESLEGKRSVLALGDSFTAGWGIRDYRDRYQNVLADRLGPEWLSVTRAQGGWHTGNELYALTELDFRPDLLVLQYYINDIEGTAATLGRVNDRDAFIAPPAGWTRALVDRSLLADFVYWRLLRYARQDMNRPYRDTIHALFEDPALWKEHRKALRGVMAWSRQFRVPLVVLAIPHLVDQAGSRDPLQRVIGLFRAKGVPVVDVGARVAGRDPTELVVNRLDSHANEALHAQMAEWILEELRKIRAGASH